MSSTAHAPTASEYIVHHLGQFSTKPQESIVDFSIFNIDTIFWSILMGVMACGVLYYAARKATSGVPGRFQSLIEVIVEMVENQSKSIVHGKRDFIAPMALTIFMWVLFMNSLDFLPVDLFGQLFSAVGVDHVITHHRVVPTADLNGTLGMTMAVLVLMVYYGIKIKGLGGFIHEMFSAPFGIYLAPFNFVLNVVEHLAKVVSLAMRLFGNMYAGEVLFLVIAMLGALGNVGGIAGHVVAGTVWAIFHILIVVLQAFIFMMLTLVYLGQAHDAH